jgi:competence protein ComEA
MPATESSVGEIDTQRGTSEYSKPAHGQPNHPRRVLARIHDRLPPTLQGQWRLDRRTAVVLGTTVLAAALALSAWTMLRSAPGRIELQQSSALPAGHAEPMASSGDGGYSGGAGARDKAPFDPRSPGPATPDPTGLDAAVPDPALAGGSATQLPNSGIVIDVEGRVAKPGVVRLPVGSRVLDALHAAGDALPGTDLSNMDQARVLNDGAQVFVAAPGQSPPAGSGAAAASAPAGGRGRGKAPLTGPVHLNTATLEQLEQLPGVGPAMAQRVLDWRTAHGRFDSVGQLHQVKGFGPAKFGAVSSLVTP